VSPRELPKRSAIAGIRLYQLTLSPLIGRQCRFYPSCSNYAREALEEHGFIRGSWIAIRRLGRCHPFHPGGIDLVPPHQRSAARTSRAAPDTKES